MRLAFAPLSSQVDHIPAYSEFFEKNLSEDIDTCDAFEDKLADEIVYDIMASLKTY